MPRRKTESFAKVQGLATGRLGASSSLRIVDAIVTGTHEPGTSHYELLRAFVPDSTLDIIDAELDAVRLPHARIRRFDVPREGVAESR